MAHVTAAGDGVYRVEVDGRIETVYVAGSAEDRWVFWNGRGFHLDARAQSASAGGRTHRAHGARRQLTAPMPATVIDVHVKPGDTIHKGQTVMLLEAMKMELPIRAMEDAVVAAVHCRKGDLVPGDAILVELE